MQWPVASWAKALDQFGVAIGSVTLACFGCRNLGEFFGPWSPSSGFWSSFGDLRGLEGPSLCFGSMEIFLGGGALSELALRATFMAFYRELVLKTHFVTQMWILSF